MSPRRRNVLMAIWLLLAVPLMLGGIALSEPALLITAAIVTAILGPIFALAVASARLRLSDEGIELRQLGWRVSTPWDNVTGLRMVRGREGLILHRPLMGKGAERLAAAARVTFSGASFYDTEQSRLIAEHRFIPIEAFAHWLDHGDLRATLTARVLSLAAPEAFTPLRPAKLERRNVVMVVAMLWAALAIVQVLVVLAIVT